MISAFPQPLTHSCAGGAHRPRCRGWSAIIRSVVLGCGLAIGLSACASLAPSARRGDRLDGRPVRQVTILGNRSFSDQEIAGKLAHQAPRGHLFWRKYTYYDPFRLRIDAKRIEAFYREHGFFDAKVDDVTIRPARGTFVDVEFEVTEGQPSLVRQLMVRGVPAELRATADRVVARSGVGVGDRCQHDEYLALKTALADELKERAYAEARVEGTVQVARAQAGCAIILNVDPGPRVRFGHARVEGNQRIPARAIESRVAWRPGEPYSLGAIQLTQKRLTELEAFSSIRVRRDEDSPEGVANMVIRLTEAKRHEVKLGGGLGVDAQRFEIRGRAGYAVKSLFHPLVNFRFDGTLGYVLLPAENEPRGVVARGNATLERQDFVVPRLALRLTGSFERDVFEAYTTLGPRARAVAQRSFGDEDRLRISAGWHFIYLAIDGSDPVIDAGLGAVSPYRVGFFEQSLSYDRRDNPFVPTSGWLAHLDLEEGAAVAGSAFTYTKATPSLSGYLSLSSRLVVAARLRLGWLRAGANAVDAPITQRYYGGGPNSHRGFNYRRLSPELIDGEGNRVPVGGGALYEAGTEVRVNLFKLGKEWFGTTLFVDLGDVTPFVDDLDLTRPHVAPGIGLRYNTIVGPVRFDFGYRVNRTGPVEPDGTPNPDAGRWAVHFSLGEAF
jgi:translocation and assembly module TamA